MVNFYYAVILILSISFFVFKPRQSSLTSNLDPRTKKIVALEANRLSKKSRSYSMYSLHDQLKVNETANDLSNPYGTEYNSEFVNWDEYGTVVREDTMASKKHQSTSDHKLKRRGSWSAPAPALLPAPLKWLEDLNVDLGSRVTREKLQPTITDSKSIRGITTTITAKSPSRSTRDYYYDEKRPTTSAECRDYRYERPTTSADIRDYSRPMTSFRDYRYDDYDDDYADLYNSKRNLDYSYSKKDHNPSQLRPSTTMSHYKDTTNQFYDDRERIGNYSSSKRDDYYDDRKYDDRKYDDRKYDDRKYDDRRYDDRRYDRKYDDRKYDDQKYDDRKYDDQKYDDRKYDDRKREIIDRKRDSVYDERQRDDGRQRDHSSYDYDYRRRDNNDPEEDPKYYGRASDKEHYSLGHSRNTSYASSNKGSIHDEPTNISGAPLSYLDAMRHRSSVSSLSSASTPSSPATPTGYDINDYRWRRSNGLDPRIYKEQNYSPSVISKSSSSSHKYWQFEDEKYHPSALSPSRNKFYVDEEDDEESLGGYSSKRQSRDYKPLNASAMRYSSQISPTPTRSSSPSHDSYGSSRKHYQRHTNYSSYSSRPPSRATSVSSHATSIEEESAVLTDILKEAELMTLKNLTDQMSIFKPRDLSGIGVKTPSTTTAKRSSLGGQKKSTPTMTTTTAAAAKKAGVKSKSVPQTKTQTKTPTKTPAKTPAKTSTKISTKSGSTTAKGVLPNTKKGHRPGSSLSSTSSYREAYQDYTKPPPPTNFSAAREALSRARMKVEEMLEIVSNGGSLD
jgi:hypothetical protein